MPKDELHNEDRGKSELTRREWLLKLGEAAVLLGFSDAAGDAEAPSTLAPALGLGAQESTELPRGLYEPSNDHLSHALLSDSRFHPIPPGSETDYACPRSEPFEPRFFSRQEFQTVERLVGLMLGETTVSSNPAVVAKDESDENIHTVVAQWIDLRVSSAAAVRAAARRLAPDHRALAIAYYGTTAPVEELETFDPQGIAREGLEWLAERSQRLHAKVFLALTEDEQIEILKEVSGHWQDRATENAGTRLFKFIKAEAICGFYTSQMGLKELDYRGSAFYAESPRCLR
jgi:hypothetical protein